MKKKLQLEVGKYYRNGAGEVIRITAKIDWPPSPLPFAGDDNRAYSKDGRFSLFNESPLDLIEEIPSETTRHTFTIPDGVKKVTVEQVGNRIVVEMVPEEGPKPGDVMINKDRSVYIFKKVVDDHNHEHYAWLGTSGRLAINTNTMCNPGRPATPEEAQPLWDALKKAGKRWNPETMQVEEIPEIDRILEWVETNIKEGYYNHEDVAEAIEAYLKHKEGEK